MFTPKFEYKNCVQINDPASGKRVYQTPDTHKVPSVTTILSATKDQTHLKEWKDRVGHDRAAEITKTASQRGTLMHNNLENYLLGNGLSEATNAVHAKSRRMAEIIIEQGLCYISEVWAVEQHLYFPELYAGTTDGIGIYKGEPAIFDYKQTNKPKKEAWIEDYKLQLVAYAEAHNEVYGTNIRRGAIFMCSKGHDDLTIGGEEFQLFELTPEDYPKYLNMWLDRVEKYYSMI